MKTFYIIEKQACVVTWRYPVEAETEADALEKYCDGDHGPAQGPEIGDSLDAYQFNLDIES